MYIQTITRYQEDFFGHTKKYQFNQMTTSFGFGPNPPEDKPMLERKGDDLVLYWEDEKGNKKEFAIVKDRFTGLSSDWVYTEIEVMGTTITNNMIQHLANGESSSLHDLTIDTRQHVSSSSSDNANFAVPYADNGTVSPGIVVKDTDTGEQYLLGHEGKNKLRDTGNTPFMMAGKGEDDIRGSENDNVIFVRGGDNFIDAAGGKNKIYGGRGREVYRHNVFNGGHDTIFNRGGNDDLLQFIGIKNDQLKLQKVGHDLVFWTEEGDTRRDLVTVSGHFKKSSNKGFLNFEGRAVNFLQLGEEGERISIDSLTRHLNSEQSSSLYALSLKNSVIVKPGEDGPVLSKVSKHNGILAQSMASFEHKESIMNRLPDAVIQARATNFEVSASSVLR